MSLTRLALGHLARAVNALFLILIVKEAFCTLVTSVDSSNRTVIAVAQQTALVFTNVKVDVELEPLSADITSGWSTDGAVTAFVDQARAIDARILRLVQPVPVNALLTLSWIVIANVTLRHFASQVKALKVPHIEVVSSFAAITAMDARYTTVLAQIYFACQILASSRLEIVDVPVDTDVT